MPTTTCPRCDGSLVPAPEAFKSLRRLPRPDQRLVRLNQTVRIARAYGWIALLIGAVAAIPALLVSIYLVASAFDSASGLGGGGAPGAVGIAVGISVVLCGLVYLSIHFGTRCLRDASRLKRDTNTWPACPFCGWAGPEPQGVVERIATLGG